MLWTSSWRNYQLCVVCVCVCRDKEDFVRRDKGFNSACVQVCIVVCCINRQQLWFILYSQCSSPLYLTGKVKAYSLEAVLQRSTSSLRMRNREKDRQDMYSSPLFDLHTASDILKTFAIVSAAKAQQYLSFGSLHPCSPGFFFVLSSPCRDTSSTARHKNSWPWQSHL